VYRFHDYLFDSIFRSKYGEYPEYHTSLDNFNLVTIEGIKGGFAVAKTAIEILLNNVIPKNRILCEPNMGKRKLYPTLSSNKIDQLSKDIMNFLTYADGKNELKTIAKYIKKNYSETKQIYNIIIKKNLIT
jgi:aminopeptidase-like protein